MADKMMTLDSYGMRQMAEYSSGVRGEQVYFVATPDPATPGNYLITPSPDPVLSGPGDVVVPCETAFIKPKRPRVKTVTLTYEHGDGVLEELVLDGTKYDALFWSESAVEKFLFPYYASKYQWAAAQWLGAMSTHWYGFEPTLGSGLPSTSQAGEETDSFAMVHYPRSDYAFEDGDEPVLTPGADVHMLRVVEGRPAVTPLVELVRQPATP